MTTDAKGQKNYQPMASCDPLLLMPGHRLSKMIKEGGVYIERIKQVQPKINCMAEERFERALSEARQVDSLVSKFREVGVHLESSEFSSDQLRKLSSPLLGVPVSIKESIMVEGMLNTCGIWERRNTRADRDAVVVQNCKRLGLIPICTTNIPELTLFWADCQNPVYGRSNNPYDLARITGASSGGEAGLIAAAGSLLGVGSDVGGSLRTPAHYCGIFAHKPSPFLVSSEGNWPAVKEARLRMFTLGPMSRYATDLRHLLKCLLLDSEDADAASNPKRDSYFAYQPKDIGQLRKRLIGQLDDLQAAVDLSQVTLFHCDFKRVNALSALIGQRESSVQRELREAQQEVVDHFVAKFNCRAELIDLDRYLKDIFKIWNSMLLCGATKDHEVAFEEDEAKHLFGISNLTWEVVKWCLGVSHHTKETLLTLLFGITVPHGKQKAFAYCDRFEKLGSEFRAEIEAKLGQTGVIIMPTLPTVAHKHNYAILKTDEVRFPCLFNVLQFPATQATVRLDKQHKLPYGMTLAATPYNDHLTIAMAEEIESAFGGWTLPANLTTPSKGSDAKRSTTAK